MGITAEGYWLTAAGKALVQGELKVPSPGAGEAVVEVISCGLCHTDLGLASGRVGTRKELPLVLGHEVVGRAVEAGAGFDKLKGRLVVVPSVLPCCECAFCKAGRGNSCPNQKMPGNDIDGGFATHILVPASPLVPLAEGWEKLDVRALGVVPDLVSTAHQALLRAGVSKGDLVVVIGAGGIGAFAVQIAAARGARVVAMDIDQSRLDLVGMHGAEIGLLVGDVEPRAIKGEVRRLAQSWTVPSFRLKILECSGSARGQLLAYTLVDRASTLVIVGYTPRKVQVRLSNLMAYDATVHGTWGCPPEAYPEVLDLILRGRVRLGPFVEHAPMSRLNELLSAMQEDKLERRMVLDPRA
jgi:6-hydroxycyclohex-1-ene-1-carbonyl-CoA dehydrogenase